MKEKALKVGGLVKNAVGSAAAKKLFSYPSFHSVRLHDWRLGLLFKLLQLGVFLYILIYLILVSQRYLLISVPIGNIDVSIQSPQTNNVSYIPPPPSDIPYCNESQNASSIRTLPCAYWTEELVLNPELEERAVFVTTRFVVFTNTLLRNGTVPANFSFDDPQPNCDYSSSDCFLTSVTDTGEGTYVALIEKFTIRIIHAWQAIKFKQGDLAANNAGALFDPDGHEIAPTPGTPETIGQHKPDIFMLSTLLRAAGITLDTNTTDGIVPRYDGVVLLLIISYTNIQRGYYRTDSYSYKYTCFLVRQTTFSSDQQLYSKDLNEITTIERHGIRILVIQTGKIGIFDFQTLLLSFTSGLGLLAVARAIVDVLAGFCWGTKMVTDSHFVEDEDGVEPAEATQKDRIIRFAKYPFMRVRDKEGNVGDRILPWGNQGRYNKGEHPAENNTSV